MASVEVMVGPDLTTRVVEAIPFLPGLVLHKTPDSPAPHEHYNVTHRASGLAVLTNVHERDLPVVRRLLGDACWTVSAEEIFQDHDYYRLIRMVLASLRGQDVLGAVQDDRRRDDPDMNWGFFAGVITPSLLVGEVSGTEQVAVQEEVLQELARRAAAQTRVPVLLVHIKGKEELAVVPYDSFPKGFFSNLKLSRTDATVRRRFVLDAGFADRSVRGHCLMVSFGSNKYVALGYLSFLSLAKRGLS